MVNLRKLPITDNLDIEKFLYAGNRTNQVRAVTILLTGMYPHNLRDLTEKSVTFHKDKAFLEYRVAKQEVPKTVQISTEQGKVIQEVIKGGGLKIQNKALEKALASMGGNIDYVTPPVSPYTLRNTFIVNLIRRHWHSPMPKMITTVCKYSGCNTTTVRENRQALGDYSIKSKDGRGPVIDLQEFEFKEG